jgi:hypothetical protein
MLTMTKNDESSLALSCSLILKFGLHERVKIKALDAIDIVIDIKRPSKIFLCLTKN